MRYLSLIIVLFVSSIWASDDADTFYRGVDLSYVNEMEDCGAAYYDSAGIPVDPYTFFADSGANLVRVRLWHTPTWTSYSTFEDVVRSLERAKVAGMNTLLDFHYSDTWADPNHQTIPAAWQAITDTDELADVLYEYTVTTLTDLDTLGLLPDMVQVGNEINTEILRPPDTPGYPIDWERNIVLLNHAIQAVRDVDPQIQVMIHIAQPDGVVWWLDQAIRLAPFDILGLSYYPAWSDYDLPRLGELIQTLSADYRVMIVETAYPWTLDYADNLPNLLWRDSLLPDYPATPQGQYHYLLDLTRIVSESGGVGVVYWEPAWVSTTCGTPWGTGSAWENATLFDFDGHALPAIGFFSADD
ncbi:MAG: arabinogalactan endo-1,4-beta-galactosidase [Phototrophicales bacterium]|nr:MAG: arabinogalactan endo-1,4-beta-galactosidase [Phototrophicales bacterium]RMG72139.1 MAG: arabinogalactan endo-1,4-beta-galactosidase [Chloroflexota bacterium]